MHSEWLLELPDEFESRWVFVPVPVGKRVLLHAEHVREGVFDMYLTVEYYI